MFLELFPPPVPVSQLASPSVRSLLIHIASQEAGYWSTSRESLGRRVGMAAGSFSSFLPEVVREKKRFFWKSIWLTSLKETFSASINRTGCAIAPRVKTIAIWALVSSPVVSLRLPGTTFRLCRAFMRSVCSFLTTRRSELRVGYV